MTEVGVDGFLEEPALRCRTRQRCFCKKQVFVTFMQQVATPVFFLQKSVACDKEAY